MKQYENFSATRARSLVLVDRARNQCQISANLCYILESKGAIPVQQRAALIERLEQIIAQRPPRTPLTIPAFDGWRDLYLAYRRLVQVAHIREVPINGLGLSAEELTGHHLIAAATAP